MEKILYQNNYTFVMQFVTSVAQNTSSPLVEVVPKINLLGGMAYRDSYIVVMNRCHVFELGDLFSCVDSRFVIDRTFGERRMRLTKIAYRHLIQNHMVIRRSELVDV